MNPWKLTSLVLALVLALVVGFQVVDTASAAPQGHMRSALNHLRLAKDQLQKATHDKGGHRVKAIELTNGAIDQVQAGIRFDNRH